MKENFNAVVEFSKYVILQAEVCNSLKVSFPNVNDTNSWIDLPRIGTLKEGVDDYWEFERHGSGVQFNRVIDGTKVDVPTGIFGASKVFDSWRLVTYFDSLGITTLEFDGETFQITDKEIDSLLLKMETCGVVRSDLSQKKGLYVLSHGSLGSGDNI